MKFTLSWLKQFLDTKESLHNISATLTRIGFEVESIIDRAHELEIFSVAKILEATPHPSADKLKVCVVETKSGNLQIVCGAPNARAGIKVVLAPVGAIIPNGNFTIKKAKIRDVESSGMMCSYEELLLDGDSSGIIELPEDAKVGEKAVKYLGGDDPIIEISVTPNRGDALGVYGIARDLAAAGIGKLKAIVWEEMSVQKADIIENTKDCPAFVAIEVNGLNNCESPTWLQNLLKSIGCKPISAIVDVTNYFCFAFGRPMHAYDKDKLSGPLKVTRAKNSEMFHPLSGKSHELNSNDLVIRGSKEVQALGGIIGSMNSACSENTKNITLEAAIFDKDLITATGRKLGIETDARYRFERQTDIALLVPTSLAAARMMVDICGGEIAKVELSGSVEYKAEAIELDVKTINSFTAADIGIEISAKILQDLGFSVKSYNDKLEATPPSWRHDISIKEDLIEEIVRIYDFEKIPMVPIPVDVKFRLALNNTNYTNIARRVIASLGYDELITYSFMSSKHAKLFTSLKRHCDERSDEAIHNNKMDRPTTLCSVRDDGLVLDRQEPLGPEVTLPNLYLKNPISSDLDYMRPSILPNFLSVVAKNATRSINKGALFEVGPVFTGVKAEEELLFASGVSWGKIENNLHSNREVDIFDVKADIILLLQELGLSVDALSYKIDDLPSYYHPTRSAAIMIGKNLLGYFGEIHPIILKEYDIEQRIVAFEINLSSLPEARLKYGLKPNYKVSDYQMNVRDFAFLVDEAVQIGPVAKIINSIDKALIRNVEIFDIYKGEKIESGKKSVAISVSIQADDRTLSEGELHDLHSKIIASIEKFGGEIRK